MVVYTWEAEAPGLGVQGQNELHSEFQYNLSYIVIYYLHKEKINFK